MVDDRLLEFPAFTAKEMRKIGKGLEWYVEEEYLTGELLGVSQQEINAYSAACDELYDMYERAAQHVIDNRLWREIGIPSNATRAIQHSWENRFRLPLLYGRFDLSGVIDGTPAKLIEFNADTATILPETVDIQAHQLKRAGLPEHQQFNSLVEHFQAKFSKLGELYPDKAPEILFSTMGHHEDNLNAFLLANMAHESGFHVRVTDLPDVIFSPDEGLFVETDNNDFLPFDFWFKLIPWEFIALKEPKLMDTLTQLILNEKLIVLNPAYSMLFQSKGMLKILWDLFPRHRLLLRTANSAREFRKQAYVEKVIFGREGENIQVVDETGRSQAKNHGDFGHFPKIYQTYTQLPEDSDGDIYQAGVFYTGQASALSFRRRDGLIVDADSEFIGHYLM